MRLERNVTRANPCKPVCDRGNHGKPTTHEIPKSVIANGYGIHGNRSTQNYGRMRAYVQRAGETNTKPGLN